MEDMLLEPGVVTEKVEPVPVLETKNTAASACRDWLEIVVFRMLSPVHLEKRNRRKRIVIRAAIASRGKEPDGTDSEQVVIKGVARHPNVPSGIRFLWRTNIVDNNGLRMICESLGSGEYTYMNSAGEEKTQRFSVSTSAHGFPWVFLLGAHGELTSARISMARGKMRPRPKIDYEP